MLERVWNGTLIIRVVLYPDTSKQASIPFFASIKRIHYPYHLIPLVTRFYFALGDSTLSTLLTSDTHPIWFEFKYKEDWHPVHWHRPLGIVSDIVMTESGKSENILQLRLMLTGNIPFQLPILHADESFTRQHYFNALKEAEALRRTRYKRVMEMERDEQNALWDAVRSSDTAHGRFAEINSKTILRDSAKGLPLKLYVCEDVNGLTVQVRTGPIWLYSGTMNIGEVIHSLLGKDFGKLITHGVELEADTPISILLDSLTYPDNLLHIVVVSKA